MTPIPYYVESLGRSARALERWLEQAGYRRIDRIVQYDPRWASDRKAQMAAWLRDALIWAIEEYCGGRLVTAVRGLLLATSYVDAAGGHNVTTHDAAIDLRNAIEQALQGVG